MSEYTPEREVIEEEFYRHQPVLSMKDGSIAGCQCMDRVFYRKTEDWGSHLADVHQSLLAAHDAEVRAQALVVTDGPKRLAYEVNMMLSSVASHGPAALTTTDDPQYTARLLSRLRDSLIHLSGENERLRAVSSTGQTMHARWQERAEVAEAKLAALEAQPDWEYGEQSKYSDAVWLVDRDNTAIWDDIPSDRRVRRREAGPWEPVPDTRSNT